jgi:hypothetical protein
MHLVTRRSPKSDLAHAVLVCSRADYAVKPTEGAEGGMV